MYGGDDENDGLSYTSPLLTIHAAISKATFYVGTATWTVNIFTSEKPKKGYTNCVYTITQTVTVANKVITLYSCPIYDLNGDESHYGYDRPAFIFDACSVRATNYGLLTLSFMNITFNNADSNGCIRAGLYARVSCSNCNILFNKCVNGINARDGGTIAIGSTCSLFSEKCTSSVIYGTSFGKVYVAIEDEGAIDLDCTGSNIVSASWGAHVVMFRLKGTIASTSKKAFSVSRGGILSVGYMAVTVYSTGDSGNFYNIGSGGRFFLGGQTTPGQ